LPYLNDAIESIFSQVEISFELIIVDDASMDGTSDYLNKLSSDYSNVLVLTNKKSIGLTKSLNIAIGFSQGQYIARIDHDDYWLPGKLKRELIEFQNDKDMVLVGTSYIEKSFEDSILCVSPHQTDKQIRRALYSLNPILHSSVMFKRELIEKLGAYNESFIYAQDYEYWTRLLSLGKGSILSDVLCVRRVCDSNISVRKARAQRFNALRAKLLWTIRNGFSFRIVLPIFRDCIVICMPTLIANVIRSKFFQR
jgi:glycosyltransferase involved in cell wall biosynthesis